jgi:hypothetical protein
MSPTTRTPRLGESHPNVLLVVMDTARADAFEPYGAPAGSTPVAAQLARRGAACSRAVATASWTVPSHASMFSGAMPRSLGLGRAPGETPHGCRPVLESCSDRLLSEVLRRAGYVTRAASANLWISPQSGFDVGFDEFVTVRGRRGAECGPGLRAHLAWLAEGVGARVDDGAVEVESVVARWMDRDRDRSAPFFWFVNLVECHSPYLPPRPYDDLSLLQRVLAASEARRHLTLRAIWRNCAGGFDIPERALGRMRHLYGRAVRMMDDWLGRVLDRMDACGILDETLVIVTSDHGENLGEGNLIGHALSLDHRLIGVPLISAGPVALGGGDLVSLARLPRLIADAVCLAEHPWTDDPMPEGLAAAQCEALALASDPRARRAVEDWGLDDAALRRVISSLTCVTDGRLKLLRAGDRDLVLDLEADPLEVNPVPADEGSVPASFRRALASVMAQADPAPVPVTDVPDEEREDLERRMRLLGYM